jgi:hypothetical protein
VLAETQPAAPEAEAEDETGDDDDEFVDAMAQLSQGLPATITTTTTAVTTPHHAHKHPHKHVPAHSNPSPKRMRVGEAATSYGTTVVATMEAVKFMCDELKDTNNVHAHVALVQDLRKLRVAAQRARTLMGSVEALAEQTLGLIVAPDADISKAAAHVGDFQRRLEATLAELYIEDLKRHAAGMFV